MVLVKETKGYDPKRKTGMWGKDLIRGSIGDIGGDRGSKEGEVRKNRK